MMKNNSNSKFWILEYCGPDCGNNTSSDTPLCVVFSDVDRRIGDSVIAISSLGGNGFECHVRLWDEGDNIPAPCVSEIIGKHMPIADARFLWEKMTGGYGVRTEPHWRQYVVKFVSGSTATRTSERILQDGCY